jgi:hypothetical protein
MKNKLAIISIFILAISFYSCQKESGDSTYCFKAKVDDKWVNYNEARYTVNADPANPNMTYLQFYGGDDLNNLNIILKTTNAIGTGEYTTSDSLAGYQLMLNIYRFNLNGQYYQNYSSYFSVDNIQPSYTLSITSYSENEIKGSITGNYLYNIHDGDFVKLTEAEFVARKVN